MIITIDGPAGAGKSSAARELARRLGFDFLDTGAMYRAAALAGIRAGIDLGVEEQLGPLMARLRLEMPPGKVILDGEDVTGQIRTPEVTAGSSVIAQSRGVRQHLAQLQRRIAEGRNFVCEGRDQGTFVFPDSPCKIFLQAAPRERARRRQEEMAARGEPVDLAVVLQAIQERDQRDAARDLAPMKPAEDAVVLDTTPLTLAQVIARLEEICRSRMPAK